MIYYCKKGKEERNLELKKKKNKIKLKKFIVNLSYRIFVQSVSLIMLINKNTVKITFLN